MNFSDNQLDQLFNQARNEKPVASLDETKKAFVTATITAAGGVLATKGLLKLLTFKKWIIMISTVSIITTSALIVGLSSNPSNDAENSIVLAPDETEQVQNENITEPVADNTIELSVNETEEIPTALVEVNEKDIFELIDNEPEFLETNDFKVEEDPEGIAFTANPPRPAAPSTVQASTEKIKPYNIRFDITENTTKKDFEEIKKKAERAGIEFHYKARYNKADKLSKLRLKMKLKDEKGGDGFQYIMKSLNANEGLRYTVAWQNTEDGKAMKMYSGDTQNFDDRLEGSVFQVQEAETLIAELELDRLLETMDSLADRMGNVAAAEWDELEDDVAFFAVELEDMIEEIDRDEINELVKEITSSSTDLVRVLKEEIRVIQIEMQQQEEKRKAAEKEKAEEEEHAPTFTNKDKNKK